MAVQQSKARGATRPSIHSHAFRAVRAWVGGTSGDRHARTARWAESLETCSNDACSRMVFGMPNCGQQQPRYGCSAPVVADTVSGADQRRRKGGNTDTSSLHQSVLCVCACRSGHCKDPDATAALHVFSQRCRRGQDRGCSILPSSGSGPTCSTP
jgi:hypothetical protein